LDFLVYAYHFVAGPTSFAPIIEMAMTIVEQSAGQYHVLLIIADGQVRYLFYSCNLNSETNKGQKCHACDQNEWNERWKIGLSMQEIIEC